MKKISTSLKVCLAFLALAGILYLIRASGLDSLLNTTWVDAHIRGQGAWGYGVFLFVAGGLTAIGVPRQIISFMAGYAFGAMWGTIWGVLGTTLGCIFVFYWARIAGRRYVVHRYAGRIERLNAFIAQSPFSMTLVIRCLPVGNNLLTNLLAGVSTISATAFISGSCTGYIPQTLIFALLGSGVRVDPLWRTAVSAILFMVSSALGWMLYRRYRIGKMLDKAEEKI